MVEMVNKFRDNELSKAIKPIDKNKPIGGLEDIKSNVTTYYTIIGKHDALSEDGFPIVSEKSNDIYAKMVIANNRIKYFIRTDSRGYAYNPMGMFVNERASVHTKELKGIKDKIFAEVNQKSFNYYIQFLKTKNVAWYRNAEREMA